MLSVPDKEDVELSSKQKPAEIIKGVRTALGLTQQDFATRLGVALPTVSRWENEKHSPSPLALDKVEAFLKGLGKDGKELRNRYFGDNGV